MYLDDGLGGGNDLTSALKASSFIKQSLSDFGFLIAEEKCIWYPCQNLVWIGLVWDMLEGKIRITDERINRLIDNIEKTLSDVSNGKILYKAKFVAGIVGQLISMQAVIGNSVRLRTRELYKCIALRASWKALVALTAPAVEELRYWTRVVKDVNEKGNNLHESDLSDFVAYTDASEVGFGGYVVPVNESLCAPVKGDINSVETDCSLLAPRNSVNTLVGNWSETEQSLSSTWRELEAAHKMIESSVHVLKNHTVTLKTDNKNVSSIVKNGSKKHNLQMLACDLYSLCTHNNIKLIPQWVPRENNKIADSLSRYVDCDD